MPHSSPRRPILARLDPIGLSNGAGMTISASGCVPFYIQNNATAVPNIPRENQILANSGDRGRSLI
jgi:hypothetical protein